MGKYRVRISFLSALCLIFIGHQMVASGFKRAAQPLTGVSSVLLVKEVQSPDSSGLFPVFNNQRSFNDIVSEVPVSLAGSNQESFFQWMDALNWQDLNPGVRLPARSYLYWLTGTLQLSNGNTEGALGDLNKSLAAARDLAAPLDTIVPKIYNNLALANEKERNYSKAIEHYKESIFLLKLIQSRSMQEQKLFFPISNLASLYDKMGNYSLADQYYRDAATLLNIDTISRENSFFIVNLLTFYNNSGQTGAFHELQQRSEPYFSGPEATNEDKAFYLNLTGSMFFMEGNYRKAIYYKKQALYLSKLSGNGPLSTQIETHLVHCYTSIGAYSDAQKYAGRILESEHLDDELQIRISILLAKIYARLGKVQLALHLLEDVQHSLTKLKSSPFLKQNILLNAGHAYLLLENYHMSESCFYERLTLLNRYFPENSTYISNSYLNLAISDLHLGDIPKAETYFLKSLEALENENRVQLSLYDQKIVLLSHLELAKICKKRWLSGSKPEDIACGMEHITKAMEVVDQFRSEIEFDQDRITMAGRVEEILDLGVWLSAQNYLSAPGTASYNLFFAYSQRKKNNSLLTAIKEKNDQIRANLPASLFHAENETKSKIATLQYHLGRENEKEKPDGNKINYWQKSLVGSYRELDSLKDIIKRDHPAYYELKYESPFITLEQAQSGLKPDQAFLDMFLNTDYLIVNLITRDTVKVIQKETDSSLMDIAEQFNREASTPFTGFSTREDIYRFFTNAHTLYKEFLEPVNHEIRGKKLILVPDNILASLPFEALVTRPPDENTLFNNAPWLIHQHSVSYLYNAALLSSANDDSQHFSRLTAFAPDYHGTVAMHDSVLLAIRQGLNAKLRPIPGATDEVNLITRIYRGSKFMGSKASIRHFEQQLKGHNIMHLAMHSLISGDDPMDSKLVFSPGIADSTGVLEAQDIYNLQTSSPLIALSSCNSGMGSQLAGEGIMSLSRAFTFAGAKSTLMTLWAVNDKTASTLVSSFYLNLKQGLPKDEALSKAKNDFLQNASPLHAHPYYWANYVITGNQSPLIDDGSFFTKIGIRTILLIASGVVLLLVLIYLAFARKRQIPHFGKLNVSRYSRVENSNTD